MLEVLPRGHHEPAALAHARRDVRERCLTIGEEQRAEAAYNDVEAARPEVVHLRVGLFETSVRESFGRRQFTSTGEHPRRQIDAERRSINRGARGGPSRLAVAASNIEHIGIARDRGELDEGTLVHGNRAVVPLPVLRPVVAFVAIPGCRHLDVCDLCRHRAPPSDGCEPL